MNRFNTIFDIITIALVGAGIMLTGACIFIDVLSPEPIGKLFYLTVSTICLAIFCVTANKILKLNKICKNLTSINKQLSDENKTLTAPPSAKVRVMPDGAVFNKSEEGSASGDMFFKFMKLMNNPPKPGQSE